MTTSRCPNPRLVRDLPLDPQTESRTALNAGPETDCGALPKIEWHPSVDASCQADLEASWKVAREARLEANPEVDALPCPPTARIPSGVTMLSTPVVYKRRKKGRSAHYGDIQSGLFIEPVAIGLRSRATPDYEVDILIAADIAGKSDEEKRALVRKLRVARKGAL